MTRDFFKVFLLGLFMRTLSPWNFLPLVPSNPITLRFRIPIQEFWRWGRVPQPLTTSWLVDGSIQDLSVSMPKYSPFWPGKLLRTFPLTQHSRTCINVWTPTWPASSFDRFWTESISEFLLGTFITWDQTFASSSFCVQTSLRMTPGLSVPAQFVILHLASQFS